MTTQSTEYQPDILGTGFEILTLNLTDDYDGKVIATLVRKQAVQATKKAVLYIHGFIDYFFQTEMAEQLRYGMEGQFVVITGKKTYFQYFIDEFLGKE